MPHLGVVAQEKSVEGIIKKKSLQQKYMKIKDILGMLKGFYDELLEHSQCFLYDWRHVVILIFGKATAKDNILFLICQVLILSV